MNSSNLQRTPRSLPCYSQGKNQQRVCGLLWFWFRKKKNIWERIFSSFWNKEIVQKKRKKNRRAGRICSFCILTIFLKRDGAERILSSILFSLLVPSSNGSHNSVLEDSRSTLMVVRTTTEALNVSILKTLISF